MSHKFWKIKFKGALVGGPDNKDEYKDDRNDYEQSEVALDYNACFQGKDWFPSDNFERHLPFLGGKIDHLKPFLRTCRWNVPSRNHQKEACLYLFFDCRG